ncbi:unnamed protein product, partial [Polarella glacialis]
TSCLPGDSRNCLFAGNSHPANVQSRGQAVPESVPRFRDQGLSASRAFVLPGPHPL